MERAEIRFIVKNPSNTSIGVKYGINGVWYQTIYVKAGKTATIKSNVALATLNLGSMNKVQFKTTVQIDNILPIKGYLVVKWERE